MCLPNCEETHYTVGVSASPFRECNDKNLGLTNLCNLDPKGSMAKINPHIYGDNVLNQYAKAAEEASNVRQLNCCEVAIFLWGISLF